MAQRSIKGNQELAKKIRLRRNELNLTIEEAALRAGVGTKTWSRYETGESIRRDKCRGICKALNWRVFPDSESDVEKKSLVEEYRDHEAWSQYLADNYGLGAAAAFAAGSDMLLDYIKQDQSDLASMPAGAHIGQLPTSFISPELPEQFLMRYDYVFLYQMKCALIQLRGRAKHGMAMTAHSILEELIIYLCNEEAQVLIELGSDTDNPDDFENSKDWVFDLFDDMDIITFLYSDEYLSEDHPFHFAYWGEQQLYMD
ncbi:MAG: helix-turn-helix transcriptional regulator [Bacillota bacterium]|nr:helix-turn-helix transcriptional regulator [Bacillota bacterium]